MEAKGDGWKKMARVLAIKKAKRDANTCCVFTGYQPRLPKTVEKLKKF